MVFSFDLRRFWISSLPLAACAVLLAGCETLGPWEKSDMWKDPPYANGAKATEMSRRGLCYACPTGMTGETAFVVNGRPFHQEEIAKAAYELVRASSGATWKAAGVNYDGKVRLFAPIRIFVVSIQPLVVLTIPWSYRGDEQSGFNESLFHQDIEAIEENDFHSNWRYLDAWVSDIRLPIEIRATLPKEATAAKIISKKSSLDVVLPQDRLQTSSVMFDGRRITFARSEGGTITVDF